MYFLVWKLIILFYLSLDNFKTFDLQLPYNTINQILTLIIKQKKRWTDLKQKDFPLSINYA